MNTLAWILLALGVVLVALGAVVVLRRRRAPKRAPSAPAAPAPRAPSSTVAGDVGVAPAGARAPPAEVPSPPGVEEAPALATRLGAARALFDRVRTLRGRTSLSASDLEQVEEALLRADVGTATTAAIIEHLEAASAANELGDDGVTGALRRELLAVLGGPPAALSRDAEAGRVAVWLFVGVNGVGKTTTIGKLAAAQHNEGHQVLLAAGDTFRAAAADQLEQWAQRTDSDLVRAEEGADPGAVVHDALHRAASRGIGLVLADTAGRLHNKASLLEELKKVRRVADREPGQVTEVLLVLDATTGQNAIAQAREFSQAVGVTGIVLTKLDGTARGGVVLAVQRELGIPVRLVGLGEKAEDLVVFDPGEFVGALLGD